MTDEMLSTPEEMAAFLSEERAAAARRFEGLDVRAQRYLSKLAEDYRAVQAHRFRDGLSAAEISAWQGDHAELNGRLHARVEFVLEAFGLNEESDR